MAKTLQNRSRRAQVYNLPHQQHCAGGRCRCAPVTQHSLVHDKSGKVGIVARSRRLASSIHFGAGQAIANLPDAIVNCPDIKAALARRELVEVASEPKKAAVGLESKRAAGKSKSAIKSKPTPKAAPAVEATTNNEAKS